MKVLRFGTCEAGERHISSHSGSSYAHSCYLAKGGGGYFCKRGTKPYELRIRERVAPAVNWKLHVFPRHHTRRLLLPSA